MPRLMGDRQHAPHAEEDDQEAAPHVNEDDQEAQCPEVHVIPGSAEDSAEADRILPPDVEENTREIIN